MKIKFILFFIILYTININSQNCIKGKTIDKNDKSIVNYVTIAIKGTDKGTFSDEFGNFSININSKNDTLILSSIGYKKLEFYPFGKDSLIIELEKDTLTLNEIIVNNNSKKCKKIKFKNKKSFYNEILYEGTIIRRKVKLEGKYLCNFSLELLPNYDNAKIILRPYLTDSENNPLFINDYSKELTLNKNKVNKIRFEFDENVFIENKEYYLGIETISLPNNQNYSNNIQIICSNDKSKNSDIISVFNFIQQSGKKMIFDRKLETNIKIDIEKSN
jgi:hypothetical protein